MHIRIKLLNFALLTNSQLTDMSIFDFFKNRNKIKKDNDDEIQISSDKPYIVTDSCDDDIQSFRTYTEPLKFDGLRKIALSANIMYE